MGSKQELVAAVVGAVAVAMDPRKGLTGRAS